MIIVDRELIKLVDKLSKQITRVYDGKILPDTGRNYINVMSPIIDLKFTILYTLWFLFEQNSFNCNLRCLIVSRSDIDSYKKVIDYIKESDLPNLYNQDNYMIVDKEALYKDKKQKNKNYSDCVNKAVIVVCEYDSTVITDIVDEFKPDVVFFDEPYSHDITSNVENNENDGCNILNDTQKSISLVVANKNRFVSSFTHNIYYKTIMNETETSFINFRCNTFREKMLICDRDLHIDLIRYDSADSIYKQLDKSLTKNSIKKILMVVGNDDEANSLMHVYPYAVDVCKNLQDVRLYDGSDHEEISEFSKIYTRETSNVHEHKLKLKTAINNRTKCGMLVLTTSTLKESLNSGSINLTNIDVFVVLDESLKDTFTYYQVASYLISSDLPQDLYKLVNPIVVEVNEKNLHSQLHRLGVMFYDADIHRIDAMYSILKDIEDNKIRPCVEFNETRKDKLERMFKITNAERDEYYRYDTYYIVTVPRSKTSSLYSIYQEEKKLISKEIDESLLKDEVKSFNDKKNDYSGPKWISRLDCTEIVGNKIGFANEKNNTLTLCEIVGVEKFSRKHKRKGWGEKENRNRNILFLTTSIGTVELSEFKQLVNWSSYQPFEDMSKFVVPGLIYQE